jgi:hypothetical protein
MIHVWSDCMGCTAVLLTIVKNAILSEHQILTKTRLWDHLVLLLTQISQPPPLSLVYNWWEIKLDMPPTRSSKRLANESPLGELPAKRRPKPNTNTLDAFSQNTTPFTRPKPPKKRAERPIPSSPPLPLSNLKKGSLRAPVEVSSTPATSSLATLNSTPIAKRPKPPPSPFNPHNLGKKAYYVTLTITLIIETRRKNALARSININNVFVDNLEKL